MTLPAPDSTALVYSEKLSKHIQAEIEHTPQKAISFARFMELALYTPGLGYYSAGAHKLGREGDFTTAPEISSLYARCVANYSRQLFETTPCDFLELGAGSGVFAKDFLTQMNTYHCLPKHYYILEVSAELRERQKNLLLHACPEFFSRIVWLDALPEKFHGMIFANEVLDALPVHCIRKEKIILERCVTWKKNTFTWHLAEPSSELNQACMNIEKDYFLPFGYESEINLSIPKLITTLANLLEKGIILLSDYGYGRKEYYHPERTFGTLKCFFRHHHHDNPFLYPGLQDITAHVDFTRVAESAVESGLHFAGFTTQAAFLFACGLLDFAENTFLSTAEKYQQAQAIKTLTLPSEMGELIKLISFTKGVDTLPIGFNLQERSRDL